MKNKRSFLFLIIIFTFLLLILVVGCSAPQTNTSGNTTSGNGTTNVSSETHNVSNNENQTSDENSTGKPKPSNESWIDVFIRNKLEAPVENPPASLIKCKYNGETVYYVPPACCDQFGAVSHENGTLLCFPDGGITGNGDGKCTDFFDIRTGCETVWKDTRN